MGFWVLRLLHFPARVLLGLFMVTADGRMAMEDIRLLAVPLEWGMDMGGLLVGSEIRLVSGKMLVYDLCALYRVCCIL